MKRTCKNLVDVLWVTSSFNAIAYPSFGAYLPTSTNQWVFEIYKEITIERSKFVVSFWEISRWVLLSSFCDDSNLHMSVFKYTTSLHTGEEFESISKFLTGNKFHVPIKICRLIQSLHLCGD